MIAAMSTANDIQTTGFEPMNRNPSHTNLAPPRPGSRVLAGIGGRRSARQLW